MRIRISHYASWGAILMALICLINLTSCKDEPASPKDLSLNQIYVGSLLLKLDGSANPGAPVDKAIVVTFSSPLNILIVEQAVTLVEKSNNQNSLLTFSYLDNDRTIIITPQNSLQGGANYQLSISNQLKGIAGEMFSGKSVDFVTSTAPLQITSLKISGQPQTGDERITNVSLENFSIEIIFSDPVKETAINSSNVKLFDENSATGLVFQLSENNTHLLIHANETLKDFELYTLTINDLEGGLNQAFQNRSVEFYTGENSIPDFPLISDADLLTKVQQQTFKYFWDFAHPVSGMARERNTSGDIVTSGGSGFGLMSIIVGIERNFITRQQGIERLDKILDFLETADRFHGVWPHWINGSTGKVIPFSSKDNGGDLVETSFLVQGLLTFRQYLNSGNATEQALITRINALWETVEWDWYRKNNENVLFWHWSPNFNWEMNFALSGYFEEQITYFLAAASPTHGIPKVVYTNGYGKNGAIVKNNTHYGYKLPLESPAPLFWVHYSYLGLDPHFTDAFANYWEQNVNATLINQAYCIANPKNFVGYSDECWGLTSSDNPFGYNAHSPGNDLGVITPTAALSSFPYTPEQSMKALKFFYYKIGDRLWGEYGFYDAFNLTEGWTASSYLAIDQGPIIVMIENYRTGLLWDLFMSAPEVQNGVDELSFTY